MFKTELIHPPGQARIGESGFLDECRQLAIGHARRGSFRHQLCGLLPSGPVTALVALKERREFSRPYREYRHHGPTFIRSCEDQGRH
ncbi:hypothetical protein SSCG_03156 [Streptomyces clavuligerus]|nr:hypothetical protein SSCG_03156 [Streptomyces clavuligerus]